MKTLCSAGCDSQKEGGTEIRGSTAAILGGEVEYSQREQEHIHSDVSEATRSQYLGRKHGQEIVEGLYDTILSASFEGETPEGGEEESIVSPGPFHIKPIVDYETSSDSSYICSRRRDVRHSYDTFTASSATITTPDGYRRERRRSQIANIDDLQERLNALFSNGTGEGDDSSSLTLTTLEERTERHRILRNFQTGAGTEEASFTTKGSTKSMGQNQMTTTNLSEPWSSGQSEQSLLRFPLSKIGALIPPVHETTVQDGWEEHSSGTNITGVQEQYLQPVGSEKTVQIIEEVVLEEMEKEGARPESVVRPSYELPYLAQDSAEESMESSTGYIAQEDNETGIASSGGYSHSILEAGEISSVATFLSSSTAYSDRSILEIVHPIESSESGTTSGREPEYQWRSVPMQPPEDRTEDSDTTATAPELSPGTETESGASPRRFILEDASSEQESAREERRVVPQEIQFMIDIQMEMEIAQQESPVGATEMERSRLEPVTLRGNRQGTAMSPLAYIALMQLLHQEEDDLLDLGSSQTESGLSTSPSLPELYEIGYTRQQQYLNNTMSQDDNSANNGEGSDNEERTRYDASPSGDTVASTSSYLSEIEIHGIGTQQDNMAEYEGFEIPFRELDDPPDDGDRDAALSDGETEH